MNRWNIPDWLEALVLERDMDCVYCRTTFEPLSRKARPTWEHIINDLKMITRENIARCCMSCNSSKGNRPLAAWLDSAYCKSRSITREQVAEVVRAQLPHIE
jgi:5-methylcytosine-specific restriction endonuclease McrA